ncbi:MULTISPECIES: hypothetical protein [Pseudomonas]|uniref:hypothetical protein n=1 Tax=Pseudomonas TaxID=286 RepID=UPI0015E7B565|nr:hypothetical protein [Pseudomonas putida]
MAAAPFLSPSNKEKGHALDTALDDWGADSGDHSYLVLYALRFWGPLFAALLLQLFATKGVCKAGNALGKALSYLASNWNKLY